jgi:hypothetical protein
MVMTILFLAIIAVLYKFSPIDKWWLWFAVIIDLLAQFGYGFRPVGLLGAIVIAKVLKDLFRQ